MNSKHIAVFTGVITVLSGIVKIASGTLIEILFEQGPPGWLPVFGSIGQTALLYMNAAESVGAVLMVALPVGFGYYVGQQLDLKYEYRQFLKPVVAGTTIPLIVAWVVGIGAVSLGSPNPSDIVIVTSMVLRLFTTVSLPVIVGVFAGAALAYLPKVEHTPPESAEANTDTTPTSS